MRRIFFVALVVILATSASFGALVTNGNFETYTQSAADTHGGCGIAGVPGCYTASYLTGWTVTVDAGGTSRAGQDYPLNSLIAMGTANGNWAAYIAGPTGGAYGQTITQILGGGTATVNPSMSYTLSFQTGFANPASASVPLMPPTGHAWVALYAGSNLLIGPTQLTWGSQGTWQTTTLNYTSGSSVPAGLMRLEFGTDSGAPGGSLLLLDNVNVDAVSTIPEPATLGLAGLGLLLAGILRRKRT